MYNKLPQNHHLSNKKTFFTNLQEFYTAKDRDPWAALPVTFHVHECSENDSEYVKFKMFYEGLGEYWIIKPGENSNCGQGIQVAKNIQDVENIIGQAKEKRSKRTYIVQKYIDKPLLVHKRKFDI
jgi:tubulin--tyrosine ligase